MDTLKLIRDGVRLRKTQNKPEDESDSPSPPSVSRYDSWENTELYRAIERVREQVKIDDTDDESDEDDNSFS